MLRCIVLCTCVVCFCSAEDKRFVFDSFTGSGSAAAHLQQYNVDKRQISVSGVSSGAAFATQMHVIYSSTIMGIGMIAGVPYACSGGSAVAALTPCTNMPSLVSIPYLETLANEADAFGTIDHTSNLAGDRIWIFDGLNDTNVNPGMGRKIRDFYAHYVTQPRNIKTPFNISAAHGQPTNNYGGACGKISPGTGYLNNCNYSAAYHLLNHIYGGYLVKPSTNAAPQGQLSQFSQSDVFFMTTPSMYSMDDTGYIFVPTACADNTRTCKLHVAFHGCKMGRESIQEEYVQHAGYNEVGGLNNIIILYPQVKKSVTNPQGCWDWWGYTGPLTFGIIFIASIKL